MKPIYWILIIVAFLSVSGGGVLFFLNKKKKEQKQKDETDEKKEDKKQKPVQKADPSVLQLQVRLNALLPAGTVLPNGLPKLIEDGIYGKNTAYAEKLVTDLAKNGNVPDNVKLNTDKGTVSIAVDAVLKSMNKYRDAAINAGVDVAAGALEVAWFINPLNVTYQVGKAIYNKAKS